MTTINDKPRCDAEVNKRGTFGHSMCLRLASFTVHTRAGGILHYCKRHEARTTDASNRYHSGAVSVERIRT